MSVERVVSGSGIPHIYEYLCQRFPHRASSIGKNKVESSDDRSRTIAELAETKQVCCGTVFVLTPHGLCKDELAVEAMQLFVRCYGAETGNLAIKTLPFGGMYIAGGIATKVVL